MYLPRLRSVSGSVILAIRKAVKASLNLLTNIEVRLAIAEERLIVHPHHRRHCGLVELMKQCDLSAERSPEDRAWLEALPVGREEL